MRTNSITEQGQYVIDTEKLEIGDIILEHGYEPHSFVICVATKSHYSHAMIFVGNTIIEATREGRVFSKVPNRFSVKNINDLKVLRLREPTDSAVMKRITEHARLYVGAEYSLKEAICSAKPNKLMESTEKQFCSRLVAQCYALENIKLVSNTDFCSPGDIERSELLYEIADAVRLASPQEIEHANAKSLHSTHRESTANFCENSIKILSSYNIKTITIENEQKYIANLNDIFTAVYQRGKEIEELDFKIAELMRTTGYMDGPFHDKQQNPYRYDIDLFKLKLDSFDQESRVDFLHGEVVKDLDHIEHRIQSFNTSKQNKRTNLKIFINDYEIHENMLKTMLQRTLVTLSYCDKNNVNDIYNQHIHSLNLLKDKLEYCLK